MKQESAKIIHIRDKIGLPRKGFEDERKALDWYSKHYLKATGSTFEGGFGYRYEDGEVGVLSFDCDFDPVSKRFSISAIPQLDERVPLDKEALDLAREQKMETYPASALRLVLLVAPLTKDGQPYIPYLPRFLLAPLGEWCLLAQYPDGLTVRERHQLLDLHRLFGVTTGYFADRYVGSPRQNKMVPKYYEVQLAYEEAMGVNPSKRGSLKRTAEILKENYGWEYPPDSYIVRRYLDKAHKLWRVAPLDTGNDK